MLSPVAHSSGSMRVINYGESENSRSHGWDRAEGCRCFESTLRLKREPNGHFVIRLGMADSTPDPALTAAVSNTDRFYSQVRSLHEFDTLEVRCVIDTLLSKTQEETCYQATYIRTIGNVESLLQLKASKDVQAIAMISRALFELAADARLLETIPPGWLHMTAHADVEKLRLANRIINFKKANPSVPDRPHLPLTLTANHPNCLFESRFVYSARILQ
jgi:hypothetical protein